MGTGALVQGLSQQHNEFKTSLGYLKTCLTKKERKMSDSFIKRNLESSFMTEHIFLQTQEILASPVSIVSQGLLQWSLVATKTSDGDGQCAEELLCAQQLPCPGTVLIS